MITLFLVWLALLLLLGLTVAVALSPLGASGSLAAALTISTAKMLLVAFFFMELRRSRWAARLMAAASLAMLGLLLGGTLADSLTRSRDPSPVAPREGAGGAPVSRHAGVVLPGDDFR